MSEKNPPKKPLPAIDITSNNTPIAPEGNKDGVCCGKGSCKPSCKPSCKTEEDAHCGT
jgi:hypothetical protein